MDKKIDKTKKFEIKLESVDPTGLVVKSKKMSMEIIDNPESMVQDRLVIHIGECLYTIDRRGFIIDRIIPHS